MEVKCKTEGRYVDLVKSLAQQIKKELIKVGLQYADNEKYVFYQWVEIECKNYMLERRAEFLSMLYKFELAFPNYRLLTRVLREKVDEHGALQAFYCVALELQQIYLKECAA